MLSLRIGSLNELQDKVSDSFVIKGLSLSNIQWQEIFDLILSIGKFKEKNKSLSIMKSIDVCFKDLIYESNLSYKKKVLLCPWEFEIQTLENIRKALQQKV